MKNISRVGVDIAKNVFHIHGVDSHDPVQWQVRLSRAQWMNELCNHLSLNVEVGMEACA